MAENGEQALAHLRRGDNSLVILDLKMPDMSGIEVLERMQEISPLPRVIIATAHASIETALQALRFREFDYLLKPYHPEEPIRSVRRSLMRSNQMLEGKPIKTIQFDQHSNVISHVMELR